MSKKLNKSKLVYDGKVFKIEFFVTESGKVPAEEWLESLTEKQQAKFVALFMRFGDLGKIWNERKFKHLSGTDQIFEFKVDSGRVLSFFFYGKRLVLTHGFSKKSAKTPKKEIEMAEKFKQEFEKRDQK